MSVCSNKTLSIISHMKAFIGNVYSSCLPTLAFVVRFSADKMNYRENVLLLCSRQKLAYVKLRQKAAATTGWTNLNSLPHNTHKWINLLFPAHHGQTVNARSKCTKIYLDILHPVSLFIVHCFSFGRVVRLYGVQHSIGRERTRFEVCLFPIANITSVSFVDNGEITRVAHWGLYRHRKW